jgi:hypothetical protein
VEDPEYCLTGDGGTFCPGPLSLGWRGGYELWFLSELLKLCRRDAETQPEESCLCGGLIGLLPKLFVRCTGGSGLMPFCGVDWWYRGSLEFIVGDTVLLDI